MPLVGIGITLQIISMHYNCVTLSWMVEVNLYVVFAFMDVRNFIAIR